MKKALFLILLCIILTYSCKKGEDIYPPTTATGVQIESFRLVSLSGASVVSAMSIDTVAGTINVTAIPGTVITSLFPSAVVPDGAIIQPAMGEYADFTHPVKYTVIAGNRKISKVWTITVSQ
jgi:hypothetical protein